MNKLALIAISIVTATAFMIELTPPAAAQQMGRGGYNFPARNPGVAAQYQFLRRQNGGGGGTVESGGVGALHQYVTTYSTTSTSVGNMQTVTVGDNTTATVMTNAEQSSNGNQDSGADSVIDIDNSIANSGNVNTASEEAGQMADIIETTLDQ